ncbi:DUF4395 domain-containing protein [candidate division KSB1 bacterium]|nr:DUF4395 domain-containing protein [candidate division KSB1 bacterium]
MSMNSITTRRRIEAQGFVGLDDNTLSQINYWLRLAPAICMIWTAVGTVLASPAILWTLVPFAALGAVLPGHPFEVIYNFGLRHLFKTAAIPRYHFPRRFACLLATTMLVASAWVFQAGLPAAGYALGGLLVVAAFVNVSVGFCIPSFIYGLIFGKPVMFSTGESQ